MAAIVSPVLARPVSQILPDQFDLFPVAESSSKRKSIPRPRTADSAAVARRSHYRPFSTLYTESPYIELETAQSSRQKKRASSGLQWTMTLGLNFRPKKDSSPKTSQFGVPPILKLSKVKQQQSQDATTKTPLKLRKKRSMTSIFTITSVSDSDPNDNATAPSTPKSPNLLSPNMPDHAGASSNLQRKSVTFEDKDGIDATEDEYVREKHPLVVFNPKSHWVKRHNMKLHPYNNESSYMQAYDPILLESDRCADLLLQRLSNGSPSFHDYGNKPPVTALDLGCGEGHWVLWAAGIWKTTHITGFDMVDITLPAFETTENVNFKQGNFLAYKLPFPAKTFDYIRMANLSLCVPSDMWDHLFSEVERVLTGGGRLELIDDEITFPYADPPIPKNTALKSMTRSRSASTTSAFDDYDDTDDSEYDSETLHDDGSTEGSTLNGESGGSRPPSYDHKATEGFEVSHLSASETVRPLSAPRQKTTPEPAPVALDPFLLQSDQAIWLQRSALCRDIEKVFLKMLKANYHYVYPSQHVLGSMQKVFGHDAAGKTKSFRVELAEWDSPIGPRALEMTDDVDKEATPGKRRPWKVMEQLDRKDAKQQRRKDHDKKKHGKEDFGTLSQRSSLDSPLPESLNPKAAKRLGLSLPGDAPPDSLNSKAAKRLGLPVPDSDSPSIAPTKAKTPPMERTPSPKLSNPLTAPQTVPSAKTAALLGLSYTALVAATAKATAGQRKGMKPEGYVQSPGLLIDNTKYVAIEPTELEMHACRFMHTLLGCRPMLGEYVASHVDGYGNRLVDEDTFSYYMGEYEAFRRARLGWPAVAADEEDLLISPPPPWKSSDASRIGYQPDKPVTIRRIRVFQALKADDKLLSKFSPRLSRSSSSTPTY